MPFPYTDLAIERRRADPETPGVSYAKKEEGRIVTEELRVESEEGAREIGKGCGSYTTYSFPALSEITEEEEALLTDKIGISLRSMLEGITKKPLSRLSLLVIGLGNRNITADALGCRVADRIHATAHLAREMPALFRSFEAASLAVLAPGVLSESGLEASDVAASAAKLFSPDAVIAFDALFARSLTRIGKTVQITDAGIEPGGGIGNRRRALTKETLGIPVLSVGVPTVTDTETLLRDLLTALPQECQGTLEPQLPSAFESFLATSDCDRITEGLSALLSNAVNRHIGILL